MNKKILTVILILILAVTSVFADDAWWMGRTISGFEVTGLKNLRSNEFNDALYGFRGKAFSEDLVGEIEKAVMDVEGVASFEAMVLADSDSSIRLVIEVTELLKTKKIVFDGNSKTKSTDLREAVKSLSEGSFVSTDDTKAFESAVNEVVSYCKEKGLSDAEVSLSYSVDENKNEITFTFTMNEGVQRKVTDIIYSGNTNVSVQSLKKLVKTNKKSLLQSGNLNEAQVQTDVLSLISYYQSIGFADADVTYTLTDAAKTSDKEDVRYLELTFVINEGKRWTYSGTKVEGITIFSQEDIDSTLTYPAGNVLNLVKIQENINALSDLYYNNGYISSRISISESRDQDNLTIGYTVKVSEGPQSIIEKININGLTKTKDYVMYRELELHEGDLFSKEKLIVSAQNLYNTGLLSALDYNITLGSSENHVVLDFYVEESNHMDIQFGATFGGNTTGFPVSGFLQWADHDFLGRAQEVNVSTKISPDTQNLALSFGDSWFGNIRWSNSVSLSFDHTAFKGQLQLADGLDWSDKDNGVDLYPLGASGVQLDYSSIAEKYRMDYDLYALSLSYSTGYRKILTEGRFGISGGLSVSLNHAEYDSTQYRPFNYNIKRYNEKWQLSNKLSMSVQWDARDYTLNTTKGYVFSFSETYAGGILGGISQYNRLSLTGAAYQKLFEYTYEENRRNVILSATSTTSAILPQWTKNGAVTDATTYEKLFIDGMTTARGFDAVSDLEFMTDNLIEITTPIADNVVDGQLYLSATGTRNRIADVQNGLNWYFSAGVGAKLKIAGFPLGIYLVKNATMFETDNYNFRWIGGDVLKTDREGSGMKVVLAISASML